LPFLLEFLIIKKTVFTFQRSPGKGGGRWPISSQGGGGTFSATFWSPALRKALLKMSEV